MPKVQPITSVNVDDVEIDVVTLPVGIKSLVTVYEEWTQKELDAADNLQMVRAAKETLGRQIVQSYRQYQAEAAAAQQAQEAPAAPPPAPGPATNELKENDLADGTVVVTGDDNE